MNIALSMQPGNDHGGRNDRRRNNNRHGRRKDDQYIDQHCQSRSFESDYSDDHNSRNNRLVEMMIVMMMLVVRLLLIENIVVVDMAVEVEIGFDAIRRIATRINLQEALPLNVAPVLISFAIQ